MATLLAYEFMISRSHPGRADKLAEGLPARGATEKIFRFSAQLILNPSVHNGLN